MKREKLQLEEELFFSIYVNENQKDWQSDYERIELEVISCDFTDGGAHYNLIIKRKSDNKFFKISFTDWDIDSDFGHIDDFVPLFTEVFQKPITTFIYE